MLALVVSKGSRELEVDYGEDVRSLFWRAGSYFNAWINIEYINLLRGTLKLSLSDLKRSTPLQVSIYALDCNYRKNPLGKALRDT